MLKGGCILDHDRQPGETLISVMSRHTDDTGKVPHPDITPDKFDLHWPDLGPHPKAIGPYLRGEIDWDKFTGLYLARLVENPDTIAKLEELVLRTLTGEDIVVLCKETDHSECHRGLVLGHVATTHPELEVEFS